MHQRINKLSLLLLSWGLLFGNSNICAAEPLVELIAPDFTGVISTSGDGAYQLIMQEAARRAHLTYHEEVYPQKRAYLSFLKRPQSCLYSFTEPSSEKLGRDKILVSAPLNTFRMYLFTAKNSVALTQLSDITDDMDVEGILGYEVWYQRAGVINATTELNYTNSDQHAVNMLNLGRVDVLISFMPDMGALLSQVSYNPDAPLWISYDAITCHNTQKNRQFIEAISAALSDMRSDGSLQQLLGSGYLAWDEHHFQQWKQQYSAPETPKDVTHGGD